MYKVDTAKKDYRNSIRSALGGAESSFDDNDILLLKKGAPDILLPHCSTVLSPDGAVIPLDTQTNARISHVQESWASRGQRVLLLARRILKHKDIPSGVKSDDPLLGDTVIEIAKKDLTIIGLVGIVVRIILECD